jgi:4'-phosphopantetheinyl transferase
MLFEKLEREAHVWYAHPESVQDISILEHCHSVLSSAEKTRVQRYLFPEDRHRYLISHAFLRNVLSRYLDLPPGDWQFGHNRHGRPHIANPDAPPIGFNLTHTVGLVACIVTDSRECGIDSEKLVERRRSLKIARRMFSETEYRGLQGLEGRKQLEYFFKHWTLREAYVKARGTGIAFPTKKLCFEIKDDANIRISFQAEIDDCNDNWQLQLLHLTPGHITAVAVGRGPKGDKSIVTRFFDFNPSALTSDN